MPYKNKRRQVAAVQRSALLKKAREHVDPRPPYGFQIEVREAIGRGVGLVVCSVARGQGKTHCMGRLAADSVTPGHALFTPNTETILISASRDLAGLLLEEARDHLDRIDAAGWSWSVKGATHRASRTSIRIVSSDSRRAFGLGSRNTLILCDEPASWAPITGRRLWDAVVTARGKRALSVVVMGTLHPSTPDDWWLKLVSSGTDLDADRVVIALSGDPKLWDDWTEIERVNPVIAVNPHMAAALRAELADARTDPAARTRFEKYRLNSAPLDRAGEPVITAAAIAAAAARPLAPREGLCVVGADLGSTLSWCAAAAWWPASGRIEVAGWVPSGVDAPAALVASGAVVSSPDPVPSVVEIAAWIRERGPLCVAADVHRVTVLRAALRPCPVYERKGQRSGAGAATLEDVTALRDALQGASLDAAAAALLTYAAGGLEIRRPGSGPSLAKLRTGDDALRALMLAVGTVARAQVGEQAEPTAVAVVSSDGTVTRYTGAQRPATGHAPPAP